MLKLAGLFIGIPSLVVLAVATMLATRRPPAVHAAPAPSPKVEAPRSVVEPRVVEPSAPTPPAPAPEPAVTMSDEAVQKILEKYGVVRPR